MATHPLPQPQRLCETWGPQSQLQGQLWGALCEPYFGRRDRCDRSGRALCGSEGNHSLSGRVWSFEFRLGLIPPLLNSKSVVLRKLYPLSTISPGLSFLGCEMRKVLEEYQVPVKELRLLASARSAGTTLPFRGRSGKK